MAVQMWRKMVQISLEIADAAFERYPVIYGKVGRRAERVKTGLSFPKTT